MNADEYQTSNDVIHSKAHTAQKANAFCQIRNNNQSLSYIPTFKSSTSINSIHSKSVNSSIYQSSIKFLIQTFLSNPLIAIFLYQIINNLKLIAYIQVLIPQFYIPQPLLLTQIFLHLKLHIQNLKKFL